MRPELKYRIKPPCLHSAHLTLTLASPLRRLKEDREPAVNWNFHMEMQSLQQRCARATVLIQNLAQPIDSQKNFSPVTFLDKIRHNQEPSKIAFSPTTKDPQVVQPFSLAKSPPPHTHTHTHSLTHTLTHTHKE